MSKLVWRHLPFSLSVCMSFVLALNGARAGTYSLAGDFSYAENSAVSLWSFRMDGATKNPPAFLPLLTSSNRDANALWGSDFPTPPLMWSEESGYWGIGKNLTGQELVSTRNGTAWAPGEVLFHPKGGAAPAGLVVGWTAPGNMQIDVQYVFGRASTQGDGIGYKILKRTDDVDAEVAVLKSVGSSITNELTGIGVAKGDRLFFRFDTRGEPGGDISRAAIQIQSQPLEAAQALAIEPSGGTLTAGSQVTLRVAATPSANSGQFGRSPLQWRKDGHAISGATGATYRISNLTTSDAGIYSVLAGSTPSGNARLKVTPKSQLPERFPSAVPRQVFPGTLAEQENALRTNGLMRRFEASRKRLAADRYRPAYHFVSPESQLNDPNGLCFWQGRWHMFYQAYPPDEYPDSKDIPKRRQHWGHAVSDDLVRWRDLPYAIYPGIERMCFSGGTLVERDRVVAFYPGIHAGQMVAIAKDPLLLNWEKVEGNPVIPNGAGDSCIWKEGDAYLALIGRGLWTSTNLLDWAARGEFFTGVEGACPSFLPIANKHIVLCFSHSLGGQYVLGDYDRTNRRFKSYEYGRFNHGTVSPGGVHAPSAAVDGQGGVVNILNINDGKPSDDWDQIMSLGQQLTLGPDSRLRIEPVAAVASLRANHDAVGETVIPANEEVILKGIAGHTMELEVEIDPKLARWVQLNVLRSPKAEEQTSITFYNYDRKLSIWYDTKAVVSLDGSRSSTSPDVWVRPPEQVVLEPEARAWASAPTATSPGKALSLRVFIDRSVVEVFVNRKYYLAMRVYPARHDSVGVSVRAQGQDAVLKKLNAWQMRSIWP